MTTRNQTFAYQENVNVSNVETDIISTILNNNFHISDIIYSSSLGFYIINNQAVDVDIRILGSPKLDTPVWTEIMGTQTVPANENRYYQIDEIAIAFKLVAKTGAGTSNIDVHIISRNSP